jgi:hypothetical protein
VDESSRPNPESAVYSVRISVQDYGIAAVVYGCRTWSVPLREEHTLRAFENRELMAGD